MENSDLEKYLDLYKGHYESQLKNGFAKSIEKIVDERLKMSKNRSEVYEVLKRIDLLSDRICDFFDLDGMKEYLNASEPYSVEYRREYEFFGEAIHDFRIQAGISQSELSKQEKVSRNTIGALESDGDKKMRKGVKERLMKVFHITPYASSKKLKDL
jgi:DNA-binding XRE family transcriptional regulator